MSLLYIINLKSEILEVLQETCCLPTSMIDVRKCKKNELNSTNNWMELKKIGFWKNQVYHLIKLFCFNILLKKLMCIQAL